MLPTPADSLALFARTTPSRLAAVELVSGEHWSYAELDDQVARLASSLLAAGCQVGDRVMVLARNSVRQIMLHLACARIGAIFSPLNWRLASAELAAQIARAAPRLLYCDRACESLLAGQTHQGLLAEVVAASRQCQPLAENRLDLDRPSLLLFTSGTSGGAKGVVLTERALLYTGVNFSQLTAVSATSRFLCEAPMFHVIGLVTNVRPVLQQGGAMLVSDGFEPARTLAWLADPALAISHYLAVPQMIEALRRVPGFNPSTLRHLTALVTGGAPHAKADALAWLDDGVPLVAGYGMSEAGTVLGMPVDLDIIRRKVGAAGLCAPATPLRIVDGHGRDCPPGEAGELWIGGGGLMSGYWQDEELTRQAFADGGWFRSGDIARCDEDGFFWIVDRKKDMFISGGENVYPAEIEALLKDYPGIREAAVVGIADERWGEVGCLVVVPQADHAFDGDAVLAFLRQRLAGYKVPKDVVLWDTLPRTATGKLMKAPLKEALQRR